MADENSAPRQQEPDAAREAEPEATALPGETPREPDVGEEAGEVPTPEAAPFGRHLAAGLRLLIAAVLLCSVAYPAAITLASRALWPQQSRGSILELAGRPVGSGLIGQPFHSEVFFHPRPSSKGYDGMNSGSQNLGPVNQALTDRVGKRLAELQGEGIAPAQVPVGWVTESGSSLDPHITPAAARLQVPRVSRAAGLPPVELEELIEKHLEGKLLGLFGQERVNVLLLNLEVQQRLDRTE